MRGEWSVSIRRACHVLLVDTSTYHYKSRRSGQAGLEQRIREICQTRVRYGYRRVHVLLRREGWWVNQKKTRWIYRELGLQLRNKTPKRRVKAKLREDRRVATRPNETWAMDFVHDQLATGQKLRVLTIVDTFSRFSPALEPRFSFRGTDVVEVLERVGREVGLPATIRVDQGTEFVSRDVDLWRMDVVGVEAVVADAGVRRVAAAMAAEEVGVGAAAGVAVAVADAEAAVVAVCGSRVFVSVRRTVGAKIALRTSRNDLCRARPLTRSPLSLARTTTIVAAGRRKGRSRRRLRAGTRAASRTLRAMPTSPPC
jgi:transposase InsO family protein